MARRFKELYYYWLMGGKFKVVNKLLYYQAYDGWRAYIDQESWLKRYVRSENDT